MGVAAGNRRTRPLLLWKAFQQERIYFRISSTVVVRKNGLDIRRALHGPKISTILVVGMCVALNACGAASNGDKGRHNLGYTTALAESVAPVANSPNKYCLTPTATELNQELVPETPCAIVLSRYAGLPAHVGTKLVGRVQLRSPSLIHSLTSEFNSLPHHVAGAIVCPDDDGSEIVASLKYPHHQDLRLTITLTGCMGARRGSLTRSALGRSGAKLIGQLERLVSRRA